MLAMQYSFNLPADYDMNIIRKRIIDKGHMTDHFPHLVFKSFLYARQDGGTVPSRENIYAPFYLWEDTDGMNGFLGSNGFSALAHSFGWPVVKTWSVWRAQWKKTITASQFATREILPIEPHSVLADLSEIEAEHVLRDMQEGALGAVSGFEPTTWTLVRFRLWDSCRTLIPRSNFQLYEVGHISPSEILTKDNHLT